MGIRIRFVCSRYLSKREGVGEGLVHQFSHFPFEARYILALVGSGMVQDQFGHSLALMTNNGLQHSFS